MNYKSFTKLLFLALVMGMFSGYKAEAKTAATDSISAVITSVSFNGGNRFIEINKGYELGVTFANMDLNATLDSKGQPDPAFKWDKALMKVKINYQIDGKGDIFTIAPDLTDKGLGMNYYRLQPVKFDDRVTFTSTGSHFIKVWTSDLEGGIDGSKGLNEVKLDIYVTEANLKVRNGVLLEEFTGAWCVWCPRGMETVEKLFNKMNKPTGDKMNYDYKFAPVMVHISDTFMNMNRRDNIGIYQTAGVSGFPSGSVDKTSAFDLSGFNQSAFLPFGFGSACISDGLFSKSVGSRANAKTPVLVGMDHDYDPDTREITMTLTANFLVDLDGEFRFNAYVLEDSVVDSDPSFDQRIAGPLTTVRGSKWEGVSDPMSNFPHPHVLRTAAGGPNGFEGSIPLTNKKGDKVTHQFTVKLEDGWDEKKVSLYGFAFINADRYYNREVFDTRGTVLGQKVGISKVRNNITSNVTVSPNPTDAITKVSYTLKEAADVEIRLVNSMGQTISTNKLGTQTAGNQSYSVDASKLTNGIYYVSITTGNQTYTSKLVVNK